MKKIQSLFIILIAFISLPALSQDKKPASPKETLNATLDGVKTTIVYHRPSAKGRKVMGDLVPFGQVWRTGANDATTIEFSTAVTIEGKTLPAGKYSLFTIPGASEWIVIFNKDAKQWGAYDYKEKEDALRVSTKSNNVDFTETFTIAEEAGSIIIKWENTSIALKVKKA